MILGSKSPRRKEILSFFSIPFTQVSSDFDERSIPFTGDPITYAQAIAQGKAKNLLTKHPNELILTADSIVFKDGTIFHQPEDEMDAFQILLALQGSWCSVFTAMTVQQGEMSVSGIEEAKILMNPLSEEQIWHFLKTQPYQGRAGAFFIYAAGSLLANKIDGCFYNIMGMPINLLRDLLKEFKIDLWNYMHHA